MSASKKLTEAQRRLLAYSAAGGGIDTLRPGSNRYPEVEFARSERGVALMVNGEEVVDLINRRFFAARQRDHAIDLDDGLQVTHRLIITRAGRAALAEAEKE